MKSTKKILALLLAVCMIAAMMAVPALATDPTTPPTPEGSITITDVPTTDHTFTAYQIFTGTLDDDTLEGIQWGKDVTASSTTLSALAESLKTAFVTSGEPAKIAALSGTSTAAAFAVAIGEITDADDAKKLGDIFGEWSGVTGDGKTGDFSSTSYLIEELADGYYLVKDSISNDATGLEDFVSNYLLQLVGESEIKVKGELASFEKGVSKTADGTFGDEATAQYGDTVYYKLTATLPSNLADYTTYKLVFHDNPSANVTVDSSSIAVKFDTTDVSYTYALDTTTTDSNDFTVTVADILMTEDVEGGSEIVLTYSGVLEDTAEPGTAETNTAFLEYSNDPHSSGLGKTTPEDADVITYSASFVKIDGNSSALLAGAKFKLYSDADCETEVKLAKIDDKTYKVNEDQTATATSVEIVTVSLNDAIVIKGLDEATYYLKETAAPAGYNELDDAVELEASEETTGATAIITDSVYTTTSNVVAIENNSGTALPETGGIGTTLFLVFGALAVMTAGIFLVTNQRMKKEGF